MDGWLKKRGNKYGAKKTEYKGRTYDSKKEANFAMQLDMARHATNPDERVEGVEEQITYVLVVNGVKITSYRLDFKVTYASGRVRHVDVKGSKKGAAYSTFRLKKNLMLAVTGIDIEEV